MESPPIISQKKLKKHTKYVRKVTLDYIVSTYNQRDILANRCSEQVLGPTIFF